MITSHFRQKNRGNLDPKISWFKHPFFEDAKTPGNRGFNAGRKSLNSDKDSSLLVGISETHREVI